MNSPKFSTAEVSLHTIQYQDIIFTTNHAHTSNCNIPTINSYTCVATLLACVATHYGLQMHTPGTMMIKHWLSTDWPPCTMCNIVMCATQQTTIVPLLCGQHIFYCYVAIWLDKK